MQTSSVPRSFAFPPCSWQQSPQQKPPNPAPAPLLPCSAPSVSVSPEQGMCSGHCGTCSQSPSSSFHPGFTNWPPSRACCLSFGSKGADRGPSSPQFLMLHFAPAHPPHTQEAVPWRVKEPWSRGRVPWTPVLLLRHQALWCLPMSGPG